MLIGEGEYNINDLKQIKVTDSYLGLDVDVIKCQNGAPLYNCTTNHYLHALIGQCGCLPFNLRVSNKVPGFIFYSNFYGPYILGSSLHSKSDEVYQ